MKTIEDKLNELSTLIEGPSKPKKVQDMAYEIKKSCVTDADWQKLDEYIRKRVSQLETEVDGLHEEVIKLQLADVSEMINLSYIAKKYFNKSRAWLSQRINGNKVNGKTCRFTASELATLNAALQDMSAQLSLVRLTY